MAKNCFNIIDIAIVIVSLATFILDVGTDICVCIELFLVGHTLWGWLMLVFITVPAIIMSAFSLFWYMHDKTVTPVIVVSHLLLLAPAERYLKVAYFGLQAYRTQKVVNTQKAVRALSDVTLLRLIEAFLESAPQLVLQLYILLYERGGNWLTGFSVVCSLVSLSGAMTTYCDTLCCAKNTSYCHHISRLVVHWGWQLFMSASRIAAFVFFACAVQSWMFAVMVGHWLISFLWISIRGTDFGTGYEKWLFRLVCAFIYIFVFLNLNEGKSRWRMTAYYLLVLIENTGMLVIFLVMRDGQMVLVSCLVVYAGFFIGLGCMLIYYVFLHPSGAAKPIQRFWRSFNISESSHETDPQIFSIVSPKSVMLIEGTPVHSSISTNSQNSGTHSQQIFHFDESSESFQKSGKTVKLSKQTLQMTWQSGMNSSSGSSSTSSLASTENPSCLIKRSSSITSDNSASSGNHLLHQLLPRNSLNKSPKRSVKTELTQLDYSKQAPLGEISNSNNLTVNNGGSKSPTLSRDSWTRLSDQNIQPLVLGDFTVLGINESSSTDKKVSDCSSFSSYQNSLSPIDSSNRFKDVHLRLRATIAATIAAATGNPSSSEGTSNRSQSVSSHDSAASGQDESLNTSHNITSLSHNTAFMDSTSSYKEQLTIPQESAFLDLSRHRGEALSTLPDIIETFNHEELSDFESKENSYDKSAGEAMENTIVEMSAEILREGNSSYPLDSTLTVSKLEIRKSSSYLASQRRNGDCHNALTSEQSCNLTDVSFRSPVHNPSNVPTSGNEKTYNGDSPFTDQELVTVMAKSLQIYMDSSSSVDSNNPEREGLALTLEDLRVSRESSPEPSPLSLKHGDTWKTRSASSLFHDSTSSSPPSSASKMNRSVSIQNAEAKLSPNAFKQIGDLPQRLHSLDNLQETEDRSISIPHSHALKFIMDSYESTVPTNPHVATPNSVHKLPSNIISLKPKAENKLSNINREISEFPPSSRSRGDSIPQRQNTGKDTCPVEIKTQPIHSHINELLYTSAWKRSKLATQDLDLSAKDSEVRGGVSFTKKLNVHFSGLPVSNYKMFPKQESDSGSEVGDYVSGKYCPPLCGNNAVDSKEQSIQINLDHEKRTLKYDFNRVSKSINELSSQGKKQNLDSVNLHQMDSTKTKIIRRDKELDTEKSNFVPLRHSDTTSSQNYQPSTSHSYSQYQSTVKHDSTSKSLKMSSQLHNNKHIGNKTQAQSHYVDELTDDELQLSAKHVAEYFSEALQTNSCSPNYATSSRKLYSQSHFQVHGFRQPLQRLENSQLLSPGTNNYNADNRLNISNDPNIHRRNIHLDTTEYTIVPGIHKHVPDDELYRHHLAHPKEFHNTKLILESSEPNRTTSRNPLSESKRMTPRLVTRSERSSNKVQSPMERNPEHKHSHRNDRPNSEM